MLKPICIRAVAKNCFVLVAVWSLAAGSVRRTSRADEGPGENTSQQAAVGHEQQLLKNIRQLTFEGRRAGEGYFSRDGQKMVFQSEREPGNPFFQIYLLDFMTGDIQRVSPGHGKTTCAWIHPDGRHVLYGSTQHDPEAKKKQQDEISLRESGKERRYSWDYDENFELFSYDTVAQRYTNLTRQRGYDAEGSWSPDGTQIAFASNRQAYQGELSPEMQERLQLDPSFFMEIYLMNRDGSGVRRLTNVPGYDGGPFFSPDGERICWRRFTEDGARAEIMTMKLDGTDVKQLTSLGAMSWAPFYHPTSKYLIFATNRHGFSNFELYLVDAQGRREPVRVTNTEGFDGLPVFSPDGKQLSWTTNRGASKQSQIYIADWNHEKALELLELSAGQSSDLSSAATEATHSMRGTQADCSPQDILRHVDYLCRSELEGRRTGTQGEQLATAYVAAYLDQLGLTPAGDSGTWFQEFDFTSGVSLGDGNVLSRGPTEYQVGRDWTPVSFSNTGSFPAAPVVFAGYGVSAPASDGHPEYDSFVHLDVKDKWLLVFRFLPEDVTPEQRQHLARHSSLRYKAMLARDKGALGLVLVSGPNSSVRDQLVKLRFDGSLSSSLLPIISISDETADQWMKSAGKSLKTLQDTLDTGEAMMGFDLPDVRITATIDIQQTSRRGRNVLGRLASGERPSDQIVLIGAHIDHLGRGSHSSSLARDTDGELVHWGADDNASGVAAMLEIAQWLSTLVSQGKLQLQRDLVFAAWSGEEDGLIGSSHFVKTRESAATPHGHHSQGHGTSSGSLYPSIAACLNLDMVGRMDQKLILQGVGSSSLWRSEIERRNAVTGLPITLQDDSYIPTDASVFFTHGVPILSAFTGSHEDYHTPRDTPDKLNYEGAAQIARFMALVSRSLVARDAPPDYVAQSGPKPGSMRARMRAYLGTVPDYAESDVRGVKLSAVAKSGPAAKAGVKGGDTIVELAGRKIENIYDYTYAIEALKIGQPTKIVVQRNDETLTLDITPESRE